MTNENGIPKIREGEAKIDFISRLYYAFANYTDPVDIANAIRAGRSDKEIIDMMTETYKAEKALEGHSLIALGTPTYGG